MATIGAEVGQKMRSAIKAKLLELNCYVDDELPDYVMVMVANKRTKSQMKEDLQLFLSNKTATFVDWLHIVLKKLKEVTVTNPEVYKKTAKRKSDDVPNSNVKKEKKDKNGDKKQKKNELVEHNTSEETVFKSLTDDLPINANKLSEQRKIIIMKENKTNNAEHQLMQDNFDIPLLSEVNMSTEEELEDLEKKIKSVKSRLGLLVESDDDDDDDDCIKLKPEPDELIALDAEKSGRKIHIVEAESVAKSPKKPERARITFNSKELEEITTKRKSVLDRLGKRRSNGNEAANSVKRSRTDFREEYKEKRARRRDEDKSKESILNRLGVMSKVSIPVKPQEEPEEPLKNREVPSVVKIKPRVIPHDAPQANKNLLLKAVAEAQRSVTQTPPVGTAKPDALYTKKYKEKLKEDQSGSKKLPECEKNKIKKLVAAGSEDPKSGDKMEYVPTPLNKLQEPKNQASGEEAVENGTMKQKFIVTLDGLQKTKYKDLLAEEPKPSIKSRLDWKKSPSPIIFDVAAPPPPAKSHIPDKLPLVHASASVKNKERCKYWPACRQGDKCEFVHPNTNCEKFPNCKFGEKCLFLHPSCKFASSCTRRDCPYSHSPATKSLGKVAGPQVQTCKFFPNCANPNCAFFHPKPCKFGRFCKNQAECSFSHAFAAIKGNMTWRSK